MNKIKVAVTYSYMVARTLVEYRTICKYNGTEVAKYLGINQSTLSRIEQGLTTLTVETMSDYARFLNLTISELNEIVDQVLEKGSGVEVDGNSYSLYSFKVISRKDIKEGDDPCVSECGHLLVHPCFNGAHPPQRRIALKKLDLSIKAHIFHKLEGGHHVSA